MDIQTLSGDILLKPPGLDIEKACRVPNVCELLDDEYLKALGAKCIADFNEDKRSRADWEKKMATAMQLALQIVEKKTFPWPGASNVKFPVVTIGALQFHARAQPVLIQPGDIVRYQVYGEDKDGLKEKLGQKLCEHMNWQLTEQDENWEDQTDLALIVLPIMGCVFKKTRWSPLKRHNESDCVLPEFLVVNYYTKSLETAPRISHVLPAMTKSDIHSRVVAGLFRECDYLPSTGTDTNQLQAARDKRQGVTASLQDRPFEFIEQHVCIDMDGDGYAEPYAITFERTSQQIARIVARFAPEDIERKGKEIVQITAEHYFTKLPFIPSPDGGFYDLGFGMLLSPLNESINSLINQLIDSGTLSNTAGGFFGRGIKLKGGQKLFSPFGWTPIDTVGDDIGKNIFPLPVRQPSEVLFNLLNFMVSYGEKIVGATELNSGITPGQNTPAQTSRIADRNGVQIFGGIYQRVYRGFRREFRKIWALNRAYTDDMKPNPFGVKAEMYGLSGEGVRPAADPVYMSDEMRLQQASAIKQAASTTQGYDRYEVEMRFLEALKVPNPDKLFPDPKGPKAIPPMPNPKVIEMQTKQADVQSRSQERIGKLKVMVAKALAETDLNEAKIRELDSKSGLNKKKGAAAMVGAAAAAVDAHVGAAKAHHEMKTGASEELRNILKELDQMTGEQGGESGSVGNSGVANPSGDNGAASAT